MRDRLRPGGDAEAVEVQARPFERRCRAEGRGRGEAGCRLLDLNAKAELAARLAFVQSPQRPHRFAPLVEPWSERARRGEVLERFAREPGAPRELEHVAELAVAQRGFERFALRLTQSADEMEAEPHRAPG